MKAWGDSGKMNPFKDIYDLVFQMTVRMASCKELAADVPTIQKMGELYWKLEKSNTAMSTLLPWVPSRARRNRKEATVGLYEILSHYVDVRRKAEVASSDAIDVMIAEGESDNDIIQVRSFMRMVSLLLLLRPC